MNYFRKLRDAFVAMALLVVPFLFLNANLGKPSEANALDRAILQASAPIQYVAEEAASAVSDLAEEYVFLADVRTENERLQVENDRLEEETRELRLAARENQRLRELLQLRERIGGESISAHIVGKEISGFFRVMRVRIDRGERDLVRRGMPVVSTQGLVGQIKQHFGRYSDVLLTADRTSAVDVVVQRTGARGMLRGTGEDDRYACRLQYLERTDEVQVGDEVYTSGLGQRFPAAILVGHVTQVRRRDFGLYQEAEITPAVDFSSLEEVIVLTSGSREQGLTDSLLDERPEAAEGSE
ncbi:MAG: rod shape-determining protein MreC [Myxococcales bacterium]|nr:rod shape-determining protein MreC [Myxococcales bacterium]